MATVAHALRPLKEHLCDQCGNTFTQQCTLLRHVRTQHGGVWRCARCSSTFNRQGNYIYHTRVCDFHASGKRPAEGQIGSGSRPKTQRMVRPGWQSQALNHTTDKFTLDLEKINQTPETILNVIKPDTAFLPNFYPLRYLFQKSGPVTFFPLLISIIIQKIRKIGPVVSEKNRQLDK